MRRGMRSAGWWCASRRIGTGAGGGRGTDTITLTPTSNSGKRAWVLVGINTKTNAITQALSTDRSVGFTHSPKAT
ncbi:MAG: hypothetical protein IPO91_34265 [Chloroflexi bacterium]|nr:hypothetical protein [Chloroflexota bacterium]